MHPRVGTLLPENFYLKTFSGRSPTKTEVSWVSFFLFRPELRVTVFGL